MNLFVLECWWIGSPASSFKRRQFSHGVLATTGPCHSMMAVPQKSAAAMCSIGARCVAATVLANVGLCCLLGCV